MQKKFISNLILIIVLNFLVKPLAILGIDSTVQNRVGADAYGVYFSLLNLSFLFNIVLDVGINNFTTSNVARNPKIAATYLSKLFSFRLILFGLYALITLAIALIIGYRGYELSILFILIFNQLLVTFISYFRSHFGGLHLFKTDAFISILDRLLLIIICGSVLFLPVFGGSFKIEWYIWMQTVCYGLTFLIAFFLLVKKTGFPSFKFSPVFSLAIIRKSYPYALLILLMMIYTRTDSIMLERIHPKGAFEAGIYAQGFRLLDAFFIFGMIFANLLLPIFSRLLKVDKTQISWLVNTSRNLLVGGAIFVALISFYHAEFILDLIYNKNISASVLPFQLLMWSFIGICITFIYGTLLTANGNLRFLNQVSFVGIVINIVLNSILIPQYGAEGAAFSTLITQSFTALIQIIYSHQYFKITFPISQVLYYFGFAGLLISLTFLISNTSILLLTQLLIGLVGMFLFKFIDLKGLKKSFKENL